MSEPIRVLVNGALGRMGAECVKAIEAAEGMTVVAEVDVDNDETKAWVSMSRCQYQYLGHALHDQRVDVMVDFTHPNAVLESVDTALKDGVHCVVGTTGYDQDQWKRFYGDYLSQRSSQQIAESGPALKAASLANLFVAPNFAKSTIDTIGEAIEFVKRNMCGVEIIERHRLLKADSPSGTAKMAAQMIAPHVPEEYKNIGNDGKQPARGAFVDGIAVHAVRGDGYTAVLEVICMMPGGTKIFYDEVKDRVAYMPGVIEAARLTPQSVGFVFGLENLS